MNRPTVVIVTDEPEFSTAITHRWLGERIVPLFTLVESASIRDIGDGQFDLAIVCGVSAQALDSVLACLKTSRKPVMVITRTTVHVPHDVISVPEVQDCPNLIVTLAIQIFQRLHIEEELDKLTKRNIHLDHLAALARYMLDVRHSLNNALTSILGNSDLLLLESGTLQSAQRGQVETIHNMAMRLNEIMQRFSSLQKEMQLVEQQAGKLVKAAAASGD